MKPKDWIGRAVPSLSFEFDGRAVAVTGGANGIGRAIVEFFAAAGAQVWALDIDEPGLKDAYSEMANVEGLRCDVSDSRSVDEAFKVMEEHNAPNVLVNNAGILRDGVLWRTTDEDWLAVMDVHATGTFYCTRAAVPGMRARGGGRIINTTSYTGLRGNVGQAGYATAKSGIIGFTKTAARELGRFGITVNAVSPNAATAMVESIPPPKRRSLEEAIPLGRFGEPAEMAPAVGFLASDEAQYITGVVLPIDGGLSI